MDPNKIKYKRKDCTFLGRNGVFYQHGMQISDTSGESVYLEPITSKGESGRARLELPKSNLSEVIYALTQIKNAFDGEQE